MKTELKDLKLKQVLYYMQSFVLDVNGTEFEVPRTMLGTIQVSKLYDEAIYPLYYITAFIPTWLYQEMTKNPDNIHVSMNLQYGMAEQVDTILRGEVALKTDVNGKFKVVIPYTTQIGNYSHQSEIAKADKSYKTNYTYNEGAMVEMSIYDEASYNASFTSINHKLANATPLEALKWCINKCNIKNNLISKPDNTKVYDQFSIIPQSGTKNILRIVDEFKFHNDGTVAFLDLTTAYYVTKKIGCYAWRNNEHKSVYLLSISSFSESMEVFSGVHIDDKNKETILAVPHDAFKSQNLEGAPQLKGTRHHMLTVQMRNATMDIFSPNKEYIFTIDDIASNAYNGKYHLRSMEMDLSPRGEFFDPLFTLTLVN